MPRQPAVPKLVVHEVTAERWADFDRLFSARGSPGYCWCMAWRADTKDAKSQTGTGRKALMQQRVRAGTPVGLLGYLDGEPVAWCSIAPFDSFRGLRKLAQDEDTSRIWSVTCFFVRREHRGQGFTRQLLDAAVRTARKHRARLVEGYAVLPSSPSYRHMGFVDLFAGAGFAQQGREGTRRHRMTRAVRAPARKG